MISKVIKTGNLEIPALGIGTSQLRGTDCHRALNFALSIGYRLIDTSPTYNNEYLISISLSRVQRNSILLSSKYNYGISRSSIEYSLSKSLTNLKTNYLDIVYLDEPIPTLMGTRTTTEIKNLKYEHWIHLENLKRSGKIRHIGLCNTTIKEIEEISHATKLIPEIIQNEFHPLNFDKSLVKFCKANSIAIVAHTPLAKNSRILTNNIDLLTLAKKYAASPPQIILKWLISKDMSAIPRSSSTEHIRENSQLDFNISSEDLTIIDELCDKVFHRTE